jgi:hypothetical protein
MRHIISQKKDITLSCYVVNYVTAWKNNSVLVRQHQSQSIVSYVTLSTVRNDLHRSLCVILCVRKANYDGVLFARGGSKRV